MSTGIIIKYILLFILYIILYIIIFVIFAIDFLENRINDEKTKRDFQDLPHFYMEIASFLLKV